MKSKIIIVMPAYNPATTLEKTVQDIPQGIADEIILVDDSSKDDKVLERIPYHKNSNDFVFDSQFLIQAAYFGFKIGDLPVPCRYMSEASSINFTRSMVYGLATIKTLFQFILQKLHLAKFNLFIS